METFKQSGNACLQFGRKRRLMLLIFAVLYVVNGLVTARIKMPASTGVVTQALASWTMSLPLAIMLAPVWIALGRYIILHDDTRKYLTFDARFWRMLIVVVALSLVGLIGGMPSVFSVVLAVRIPDQRLAVLAVMAGAFLIRLLMWWMALRLAIAPPMAATGTRANALDTSFSYTPGSALGIGLVKVLVYLPLTCITGVLMVLPNVDADLARTVLLSPVTPVIMALATAATDLFDGAAVAVIATILVRARQAAMKAAAEAMPEPSGVVSGSVQIRRA